MISLPFQEWFTSHNLVGGDWRFFWPENLKQILNYSHSWDSSLNTGIGKDNISFLWLNSYVAYVSHFFTQILNIPWNISEKIIFFWPIIIISFLSAFFFSKIYVKNKFLNIIAGLIYLTNTYALMMFSGGQVGVALAYSLAPLVLAKFIKVSNYKSSISAGLILALQVLFDPRVALLSMTMVSIYFLFNFKFLVNNLVKLLILPLLISILLHMFWILPIFIGHINLVASVLDKSSLGSGMVKFLSFANFENAISLLQPNWPENIFGKTGFMQTEFLLIPIIAFSSLLFVKSKKILYFALLGLLGAFLAKGSNPPFGEIYTWLTDNIGLFAIYRDPTKWYIFTVVAYSILIPFALQKFDGSLFAKWKMRNFAGIFFIIYLLFLLRPMFLGEIKGTFTQHLIPPEYFKLKEFIVNQTGFFRTLWIPKFQRFGLSSNEHPAVSWEELFGLLNSKKIKVEIIEKVELLREAGIKYIIVPYDSEGEIFVEDRKYDNKQFLALANELEKIGFLKEIKGFDRIKLFELRSAMDRFWIQPSGNNPSLIYKENNPTDYSLKLKNVKKGNILVFSEGFNPNWVAWIDGNKIASKSFNEKFNSFYLPGEGTYSLKIQYLPEEWRKIGLIITIGSLAIILGFLFRSKIK